MNGEADTGAAAATEDAPAGPAKVAAKTGQNPLSRKLQRVLGGTGGGSVAPEVLDALQGLSGFFKENTHAARRNLRGDIECRGVTINEDFITAFKKVNERLEAIQKDVVTMGACCDEMTQRLATAKSQTSDLITRTTTLKCKSDNIAVQSEVLRMFLERYQLSPEEATALATDELDHNFFAALARVREIHDRCKVLLRTSEQKAGLTIMEDMAALQESSFERLYRWTRVTCRSLTQATPDHPAILVSALRALRNRSVLFEFCFGELSNARHNAVVRGFIDALTRGGPGGLPKPIELHSHDPVRYCSDMLAWLHQAVASEKDQFLLLLYKSAQPETEGAERFRRPPKRAADADLSTEDKALLFKSLDKITEGACRPLQARIEQVLASQPDVVVCYELANLLQFYGSTVADLCEEASTASLVVLLKELHELALKVFFDQLNIRTNALLVDVEQPPPSLGPPNDLERILELLRKVLSCQDVYAERTAAHDEDLHRILEYVLNPTLEMCTISASSLGPVRAAVYIINCVYQIQSTLSVFDNTEERVKELELQVSKHLELLIQEHAQSVLNKTGLSPVVLSLQTWEVEEPSQRGPLAKALSAATIIAATSQLDAYLSAANFGLAEPCDKLLSTRFRQLLSSRALKYISGLYSRIYALVLAPESGYTDAPNLLKRTPEQVASLLQ